jgi:hypothetical protein
MHKIGVTYNKITDTLHTGRTRISRTIRFFNTTGFTATAFRFGIRNTPLNRTRANISNWEGTYAHEVPIWTSFVILICKRLKKLDDQIGVILQKSLFEIMTFWSKAVRHSNRFRGVHSSAVSIFASQFIFARTRLLWSQWINFASCDVSGVPFLGHAI